MSHALRAALTATGMLVAAMAPSAAAVRHDDAFFLINGPDYREVSRAEFDDMRPSCLRIVRHDYPESHLTEYHCYL